MINKQRTIIVLIFTTVTLSVLVFFSFVFRRASPEVFAEEALSALEECESVELSPTAQFDRSERYKCYQKVLRNNVYKYGLRAASGAYDIYVERPNSPIRGGTCHALGHDLGEAALRANYTSADILNYCSSVCEGGCFNGVGHGFVVANREDLSGMDDFCSPSGYSGPKDRMMACYHGFGHGITDVFGPDVEKGLALCGNIKNDEGRYQCGHAIFMLFSSLPAERVKETARLPEDFSIFCANTDPVYRKSCHAFSGYLTYAGLGDINEAIAACRGADSDAEIECLKRIGEAVFSATKTEKTAEVIVTCAEITDFKARNLCVFGVATTSVTATNTTLGDTAEICSSAVLSPAEQKKCHLEMAGAVRSVRGDEQVIKYCEMVPAAWKNDCLSVKQ